MRKMNKQQEKREGSVMSDKAYVQLKNINKSYGSVQVSKDVNITVEEGRLVALLGPSGSGKTTILKILAGLEQPDSGDIYIGGRRVNDVKPSERGIGFVFQSYALFRYMTVAENIAFSLKIQKWDASRIRDRVEELLELVDLKGLGDRYPRQLSGGQRQRVAFARAIAPQPKLLLLDEPFAAIDAKVRKELRSWLKELIREVGITSIFVTHDQDEATEVADDIIITNQGRVEQTGQPIQIYSDPVTPFVAQFLGENVTTPDFRKFKGFEEVRKGDFAIIRPEYINLYKLDETIQYTETSEFGTAEKVIFRGSLLEIHVNLHGLELIAYRQIGQPLIEKGETLRVFVRKMNIVNGQTVTTIANSVITSDDSLVI